MTLYFTRRHGLKTALGLGGASLLPSLSGCSLLSTHASDYDYVLTAQPAPITLIPGTTTPAWTFNGVFPGPILRVKQNRPVRILVINQLSEDTTIHWHGIRLNNAADGVPGLTQKPIPPGGQFVYEFTCPDAGTFWYHPHVNSIEQLGRGLVGLLIVDEDLPNNQPSLDFDADIALALKDWHLNKDGSFAAFTSHRAAARAGTLGNYPTINGQKDVRLSVQAGSNLRLRLANLDNTRVFQIGADFPAYVVAVEGNPLAQARLLTTHPLGSGMRVDLAIQVPTQPGIYKILDRKGIFEFTLCELEVTPSERQPRALPQLPMNPIPPLDLANATRIPLIFEWEGALSPMRTDGTADPVFWTINKRAWAGHDHHHLPDPLATLEMGKTYIFELHNATPHPHPIHLHGFTFTVLKSNDQAMEPFHTDTILLERNERAEVAIFADNPGDWMFHCHVIEHMDTGLMGYIRVR